MIDSKKNQRDSNKIFEVFYIHLIAIITTLRSGLIQLTEEENQKCDFWNTLFPELIKLPKKNHCDKDKPDLDVHIDIENAPVKNAQKLHEIETNEIEQVVPSLNTQSKLFVEEQQPKPLKVSHKICFLCRPIISFLTLKELHLEWLSNLLHKDIG